MLALPLALSLSSSFTEVGAVAAFAALLGIAVLSLLVFSQAREIKRLREWAGRAPERAAEMEQRVSQAAALRAQQQPSGGGAVKVLPRGTAPAAQQPPAGAPAPGQAAPALAPAPAGIAPSVPVPVPATAAAGGAATA